MEPTVTTKYGKIRGRVRDGVASFLGVPYAASPTGPLRFRPPAPPTAWDGIREADRLGPTPPKPDYAAPFDTLLPEPNIAGDDWLSVNVWSPDPGRAGLPVMVWIHGGAFSNGNSAIPSYDGHAFARDGVVLVSLNYRLGIDGFAHVPDAPANRGLLDQIAALEWVAENIEAFGGDPGNVTVFGESAGAGTIAALLAMDPARGLFGRAIAQSVPGTFFTPELAADVTAAIAGEAGLPPTFEELATASPGLLATACSRVTARMKEFGRWGAVRLTGHNRDEYRLFIVASGRLGKITEEDASTVLDSFAPAEQGPAGYRDGYP